ncbi:hypothetical protein AAFN85_13795 [Mucilaginibacter sp. CAU 1740]|uniref:hypothetical protein n=1 Tax=Mucilaginibacter sp. CAU 1740 TaxID=3140365 RepID=UPI00325BD527
MNYQRKKTRRIAIVLLTIWSFDCFWPAACMALTSGPAQPETATFQPAGTTGMVDLQTGDFKYNIPLLDVGGYPINLNYQSGTGIDDEASWVGLGWNLNVGSINRQLRGIPDDLAGDDIVTDHYTKPKITVGGRARIKDEFAGEHIPVKGELAFNVGVFSDNYTGIGAEVGANAGVHYSFDSEGQLTAGLGAGILSSTSKGVDFDVSPYLNFRIREDVDRKITTNAGFSGSFGYNTRSGLKNMTLGASFGNSVIPGYLQFGGTAITYNTPPVLPKINIPYSNSFESYSLDIGPAEFGNFLAAGATGYKSVSRIITRSNTNKAFGLLYAERGKNVRNGVMDFIRENENPVIPELPNLALPVSTADLFSYTSQTGSGQFKLYRGGSGIFFDNEASDQNSNQTGGVDLGFGHTFHGGTTLFKQSGGTTSRKWTRDNDYAASGDFQDVNYKSGKDQHAYFKVTGEKSQEDDATAALVKRTNTVAVQLNQIKAENRFANDPATLSKIAKHSHEPQQTTISYLTAKEASRWGLETSLLQYPFNVYGSFQPPPKHQPVPVKANRIDTYRKNDHLSEITVTEGDGKRMVYGVPVYQLKQQDFTFAVVSRERTPAAYDLINRNQVAMPVGRTLADLGTKSGIDDYYHCDNIPSYATSFLLSAVLSPDYLDKTGNGISDDDQGTAIKFNYSKLNKDFHWRTPYENATVHKCLLADPDDDKASVVYGEKELWYISSVESKTQIAYFLTSDRDDALGVKDFAGVQDATVRQKKLSEIRLYSKADMTKPIKVVKMDYDYSLCPNTPNSVAGGGVSRGKLTLKAVHFEYAGTTKGHFFPYAFNYNTEYKGPETTSVTVNGGNTGYDVMSTDRWGVYKNYDDPNVVNLKSDEFPYTRQDYLVSDDYKQKIKESAAQAASLWHLKQITLPTGGQINVSYESDDYAYVQDKKAMIMVKVDNLINGAGAILGDNELDKAKGFRIPIPATTNRTDATADFKTKYLNGSNYIYSKFYTNISTTNSPSRGQDADFISTYGEIDHVSYDSNFALIFLKDRTEVSPGVNPIVLAAWQKMKEEYPRYAYRGFDKRIGDEGLTESVGSAVSAIIDAFANLSELTGNFYSKAKDDGNRYARKVELTKSFVRIVKPDGRKYGGGARVKKILLNDNWSQMGGSASRNYGQTYDYTTLDDKQVISSGVASYEPAVGSDENPLKQPVNYVQQIRGGIDNFFTLEQPFGESFFPAPSVVYSKVTVSDIDESPNAPAVPLTGYTVNEFYTAKDFPVKVKVLDIQKYRKPASLKFSMVESQSEDYLALSQGYSIELNDMHGKPKAVTVFNQGGTEVSSEIYNYNATSPEEGPLKLKNLVDVVNQDGSVSKDQIMGRDIEFFTDFREQETINEGKSINVGTDVIQIGIFPVPIPHFPEAGNTEYKLFRSACAVKLIQYYGIVKSVIKRNNGSSIETTNVAYDGKTGEPMITRTQNEFKRDVFSVNIPAYWGYPGMGPAYEHSNIMLDNLSTGSGGELNDALKDVLMEGDQFIDMDGSTNDVYWILKEKVIITAGPGPGGIIGNVDRKFVVNRYGEMMKNFQPGHIKVVRAGARNMLAASLTSMVMLNNPIIAGPGTPKLALADADMTAYKVINASANTYDQNWSTEIPDIHAIKNETPYDFTVTGGGSIQSHSLPAGQFNNTGSYLMNRDFGSNYSFSDADQRNYGERLPIWFDGRLPNSSIIDNDFHTLINRSNSNVMGVYGTFNVEDPNKTYFVGFDSSISMSFAFDCSQDWTSKSSHNATYRWGWNIIPVKFTTKGPHTIHIQMTFKDYMPPSDSNDGGGIEIYQNTADELRAAGAQGTGIRMIWSSSSLVRKEEVPMYLQNGTNPAISSIVYSDAKLTGYSPCSLPVTAINPYVYGFAGNWRPFETMAFQQNRLYNNVIDGNNKVVNVKDAGAIKAFYPFWNPSLNPLETLTWAKTTHDSRWVNAATVTQYDNYGQPTESEDALGRFSAAKFDFNGQLPAAVAANARNREVYANSFEDANFTPGKGNFLDPPRINDFSEAATGRTIKKLAGKTFAHSGNYSVLLPAEGLTMSTIVYDPNDGSRGPYLATDAIHQFMKSTSFGLYPNGFEPITGPGRKYVFSAWVKDAAPEDRTVKLNLTIKMNGTTVDCPLACKAVVEGWKMLEGTIDLTNSQPNSTPIDISIKPVTGNTVTVDDIRIHPFDAQLKTYAYDETTMRLMAEMDENGFATFYEYDSEGLLLRVKKETERGIMTLKEARRSQKKVGI